MKPPPNIFHKGSWLERFQKVYKPGTPRPTIYKWLFQCEDSKSLYRKWMFHHFHPFINGCLGFQEDIYPLRSLSAKFQGYLNLLVTSTRSPTRSSWWCLSSVMLEKRHSLASGKKKQRLASLLGGFCVPMSLMKTDIRYHQLLNLRGGIVNPDETWKKTWWFRVYRVLYYTVI